ncbi:MAG: carboxypeptidase regulatory-like domain-containing protein [Rhizobiales bacterium]|nr:carboxypeptidase regulatory-like domain-containing protein [Hyphomicrobiales bacterium]
MTRRTALALALMPGAFGLAGCRGESAAVVPETGYVKGRAVDDEGRPLAGIQVSAVYQSYGGGRAMRYGASHSRTDVTGADGSYRIRISDMAPGEYSASAYRPGSGGDAGTQVALVAEDPSLFANNAATIRNFRMEFVEQLPGNPYGNGGIFVVETVFGHTVAFADIEVTLQPTGGGRTIVRRLRQTGEGWVATGVPPGQYRASATLGGRPLLMNASGMDDGSDPFATSLVGNFKGGFSGNLFRVRVKPN